MPFFDHLDAAVASATDAALKTIATLTGSMRDVVLPSTSAVNLNGEMYAYYEAPFARVSGRYQIPTRRNLQNGGTAKAADYVRGRWALETLPRTIDDGFADVDVVVLPHAAHRRRLTGARGEGRAAQSRTREPGRVQQ